MRRPKGHKTNLICDYCNSDFWVKSSQACRYKYCCRVCYWEGRKRDTIKRFWDGLLVDSTTKCWVWQGRVDKDGYGLTSYRSAIKRAHKFAWELTYGPVEKGLCVCHKCDNPPCCNPEHLFLGTHRDNVDDKVNKNRQQKGEEHGNCIVLEPQARMIQEQCASGKSNPGLLSKELGLKYHTVWAIAKGRNWGWLKEAVDA